MTMASRNKMIAKIKIGQKQLGLDEDTYRTMLDDRYGKSSAAKLSLKELADCIHHLENLGVSFTSSPSTKQRGPKDFYAVPDSVPFARQKRWIASMWYALGWNMSGLDSRSAKQFGVERFIWINDQNHLQTLAKDMINRCRNKGIDPDDAASAS